jgi:sugar/nucleoside kinase (ribokinase family)
MPPLSKGKNMVKRKKTDPEKKLIVGVGSALVDILLLEDEKFLASSGLKKGGMVHAENSIIIEELLSNSNSKQSVVPGGSACNTIVGVSRLGGSARFIGKRGNDDLGMLLEASLRKHKVEPILFTSDLPTGRVLSIITPDSQRSMYTYLGASSEMKPEEILPRYFENAAVVHIEGYLLFNEALLLASLAAARESGALISLDLASYTVVEASMHILSDLINDYVDILIANEDEARVFTGCTNEEKAIESLAQKADVAVLKIGKRGSLISHNGKLVKVDRMGSGEALDTTGAGDLWAAGFLYGFVNDYPIEACGRLGSACGWEVCQVIGASIPDEGWKRIENYK